VTALKSVWKNQRFQLAFKAGIFGLALSYSSWLGAPVAIWIYFRSFFYHSFAFLRLFIVFLILAVVTVHNWFVIIFLSALFYLILGLKDLIFIKRRYWRVILSFLLFYLVFLNFFLIDQSSFFALKWLGFLLLIYLLVRDLLKTLLMPLPGVVVAGWLLALIIGELLWVISWLPIGFLNSANLAILSLLLLASLTINHFWGTLRKKIVIRDVGLFTILFIVIVLTSKWVL